MLAQSASLRELREKLRQGLTISWNGWMREAAKICGPSADPTKLLVHAAQARDPYADELLVKNGGNSILPTRVHIFHRTLTGLWACVNPDCLDRPKIVKGDWPFGAVYFEKREHCQSCQSLVLEWAFCSRCGEGAFKTEIADEGTRIVPWDEPAREDGFDQALDRDETYGAEAEDDATPSPVITPAIDRRYLSKSTGKPIPKLTFHPGTGIIAEGPGPSGLTLYSSHDVTHCPFCGFPPEGSDPDRGALRSLAAGAPYLMSQIAPGVVGRLSPKTPASEALPLDGRQLITFTDARQGTARHAANIQIASERSYIRSFLYHFVQERPARNELELANLDRSIAKLRTMAAEDPDISAVIATLEARRPEFEGKSSPKPWKELVRRLASEETVATFLRTIWAEREETFSDPTQLAEFLLYREIMRRPVRANSAETLGLLQLIVPAVDVKETNLPGAAAKLGLTLDDWRNVVRLVLTHFIRTNVILDFDARRWMRWIDRRQAQIVMLRRRERGAPTPPFTRFWPDPYAPGKGIVVDGVVRESSGVTLNWKKPADEEGVREVQNLRQVRECRTCGGLTSAPASVGLSTCDECGGSEFRVVRFLAPAGFTVDLRYEVHDDTRDLGGSPSIDPWVSARTSNWRALPDPRIGRVRTGADGLVFWFNPGPHGLGFEICLHCGRSVPETAADGPSALGGHKPLRGVPRAHDGVTCTGGVANDAPFAVARHLSLGQEIRTDVCELQLYECSSREAALTIALALREIAARRLGVDADEMGFAAPEAAHPSLGRSYSAVVFDRASGGAGFCSTIARDPMGFLAEARDLLDCNAQGRCGDPDATHACPRCVLAVDSQHAAEDTDRKLARQILAAAVTRLSLPDSAKLFGNETAYEPAPLADALSECLVHDSSAEVIVLMTGNPADWDLGAWPMTPILERWGARGRSAVAIVDAALVKAADPITRRQFVLWAQRARVTVRSAENIGSLTWLAGVVSPKGATGWSSSSKSAREIGIAWAAASDAPVVRGKIEQPTFGPVVDLASLLTSLGGEALLEIENELDGPTTSFGSRLLSMLIGKSPELDHVLSAKFLSLSYSDRYIFSPLAVRLVTELIAGFANMDTEVTIITLSGRPDGRPRSGRWLHTDWPDLGIRSFVLEQMLAAVAPRSSVDLRNRLGHRRKLDFRTERGAGTIFFDQGVGSWSTPNRVEFDHYAPVGSQIYALNQPLKITNGPEGTFVAVRITN
ncbi:Zn-binding domain-containing protein [Taklimakanibacter deserti]|uniref:Zn-binding domain-containing protein n=1 Tax=Taklimakanibacter deserti TaxID=2267839 RepID=UPI000E6460C3